MVSTVSSFGGLSAADVQMLFGAIGGTSSSSSGSTTTSAAPSASAASANDPTSAIKSILAQAQINQASSPIPAATASEVQSTPATDIPVEVGNAAAARQASNAYQESLQQEAKSEQQASVSNGTNGPLSDPFIPQNITLAQVEQGIYLSLAAQVSDGPLGGQTAAQRQQLISALENHTLKFTSANIPGYSETCQLFGAKGSGGTVSGSGISVSQSGSDSAITQDLGTQNYFIMDNGGFTGWGNYGLIVSY